MLSDDQLMLNYPRDQNSCDQMERSTRQLIQIHWELKI